MALYLVNPAVEMTLELYVSTQLEEALTVQYERITDRKVRDTFVRRLEKQVETLLKDSLDWEYASGDVTLNRAWIPPLYLTWD